MPQAPTRSDDVVGSRFGLGDVDDLHLAGFVDHDRFHDVPPMRALGYELSAISYRHLARKPEPVADN